MCMFVSGLYTLWISEGMPSTIPYALFFNFIFTGTTTLTWVPVVFLLLYVVTSMIGLLPIPWTMTAELFPLEIRGVAHSIAYSMANILMFASVQSYRTLEHICGGAHGVQWFFAVIALSGSFYAFIFLPETHRKKLNQIQDYFLTNTIFLGQKKNTTQNATAQSKKKPRVTQNDIIKSPKQTQNLINEQA